MKKTVFLLIPVLLLLLVGLATNQSLWLDEATSVLVARDMNLSQILTSFSPNDFHPPLYYLLLHFWLWIGNAPESWSRLLSVMATFGTTIVVYQIGRMFLPKKWAIIAATFFATGPLVFYYSHEARMYALVTFFVTLALWSYLTKRWAILAVSCTLILYTDYMPILVMPLFIFPPKPKKLLWGTVVLIAFLPWLPSFLHQLSLGAGVQSSSPGWSTILGSFSLKSAPLLWVKLLIGRVSFDNKIIYGVVVALVSLLFFWILSKSSKKILWAWLLFPVGLGLLISLRLSIFQYFRFLFIAPAFYLLVAQGAKRLGRPAAITVLILNLAFVGYYLSSPRFWREDWRSTANYISQNLKSPSIALFPNTGQSDPYRYYGAPAAVVNPKTWQEKQPSQVWLFRYVQEIFDPQDLLRQQLESDGYRKIEEKSFNQVLVWRYEKI